VWLRLQKSLAEKNGIALTTLSRDGAVIGRIENDNSICRAMLGGLREAGITSVVVTG